MQLSALASKTTFTNSDNSSRRLRVADHEPGPCPSCRQIVAHKADYRPSEQSTRSKPMSRTSAPRPPTNSSVKPPSRQGHGRIETRTYAASSKVDWITSERSYPGQPRFKNIKTILKVHARAEYADRCSFETHYHISSAPLDIERIARGARAHWGVESMHWLLDVEFQGRSVALSDRPRSQEHDHRPPLRSRTRACQ